VPGQRHFEAARNEVHFIEKSSTQFPSSRLQLLDEGVDMLAKLFRLPRQFSC
jgi:hypothetical protein